MWMIAKLGRRVRVEVRRCRACRVRILDIECGAT